MGKKADARKAEAEEKARRKAIERAHKMAAKAEKKTRKAARARAKDIEEVGAEWSGDPRELLAVRSDLDLSTFVRDSTPGWTAGSKAARATMTSRGEFLSQLQERLFASAKGGAGDSVLLVLQGLDTAGKGGIVRHVMGLVDPQGISLAAFKAPTEEERAHDFLWRIRARLPHAGYIGVFDRSHYEDLLVPTAQALTGQADEFGKSWVVPEDELNRRYHDIYEMEAEAARQGMRIVKVCLMVSYETQGLRLRERLDRPEKNWKFSPSDLDTRDNWNHYQGAYQEVLRRTSTRVAPWYLVPADNKWYAQLAITEILTRTLAEIDPQWPAPTFDVEAARERLDLSLTPDALAHWDAERAHKQADWITDDEAISLAVNALNGKPGTPADEDSTSTEGR